LIREKDTGIRAAPLIVIWHISRFARIIASTLQRSIFFFVPANNRKVIDFGQGT